MPEPTGSYGSDLISWLNWLVDPVRKLKPDNPLVDNLSEQPSLEELSPLERALLRLEAEDRDSDIYLRRILSWPSVKPYFNLPFNYNRGAK